MSSAGRNGGRSCGPLRAIAAAGGPLLAPPQREMVGDFVGLCLLIDFSDAPATIARDEVERFCNQPGYTGFGNNGSVRDFFLANSIGRCRYSNIVAPYYRAQRPKSYYTNEQIPQPQRALELINEALSHWKAQGFDFTPLTADNQGFVNAMNVYYAGPVVNNWAKGLWPHAYHLNAPVALAPGRSAFDYQFTAMGAAGHLLSGKRPHAVRLPGPLRLRLRVHTYTAANTPTLAALAGQAIAGTWKLLVSDHEAID